MKNIDDQIQEQYERHRQAEKLELHINLVRVKINLKKEELSKLEEILDETNEELEKLESLNSRSLFSRILSNDKDQFERVRQSYLLNFIKYKACKQKIETKEYEVNILTQKLFKLADAKSSYEKLLKKKKSYIKIKNKAVAQKMIPIESNIRILNNQVKELQEAIDQGQDVISVLIGLRKKLEVMGDWHFEIETNSLSYPKRNYIGNLFFDIKSVDNVLDLFLEELADVNNIYTLSYDEFITRLHKFVDTIYDSLVSDWIFNKKLKITLQSIEENEAKVKRLVGMLNSDLSNTKEVIKTNQQDLDTLLRDTEI